MAGVKGRSGGARPGAGRKPKAAARGAKPARQAKAAKEKGKSQSPPVTKDPLDYLLGVVSDDKQDPRLRVRAAVAAAQYVHLKKGDGGIRDDQKKAAGKSSQGKFAPAPPPKLVVNNS